MAGDIFAADKNVRFSERTNSMVQFNSDICTRQLMNITLARMVKKATIIKYINEKRKKIINCEKVGFQFCSEGVER